METEDSSEARDDDAALQLAEEEAGLVRKPVGWSRYVVPCIGVAWALFQIAIAIPFPEHIENPFLLDSVVVRSVHLGFAMLITFLAFPAWRKPLRLLKFLWARNRIPVPDWILAVLAASAALYLAVDFVAISGRLGMPSKLDLWVGIALTILLLEATRRVIGPALTIVAAAFSAYAFLGPHMPAVIAFKGVSLARYIGQMTMSTEGIYGIPLDVSAKVVFLFVLFGSMLERAGGGKFFIDLALSLLGGYRGGPAKAAVLGSGLTGMVSGSSIANIVTTGTFTIPLMKDVGYPAKKAASIEVAASTDGQLAPPIMGAAAFIIAEYVSVPYLAVVKAAAVPAFASYAALFYITHLEACKLGLKGIPKAQLPRFFQVLAGGWHFLIPLAVLLYHLIIRRHSPELAAFYAVITMVVVMLIQRPLQAHRRGDRLGPAFKAAFTDILSGMASGARNMVPVAIATAAAGIIVGVVAMGLGGLVTQIVAKLSLGNIYLMLLITAVTSLLIGMGLPTTATYIVMASLIAPVIVELGSLSGLIVPLIAAHLFCFYFGILADDTPPVGLAAYAAAAIAKSPPIPTGIQAFTYDIRTAILPFMFIFNTDLILHGIDRWDQGLLIFVMACCASCAFAAVTQGWFVGPNRWYDAVLLLAATFVLFRPDALAAWTNVDYGQRYWFYLLGLLIVGAVYARQGLSMRSGQAKSS